MRRRPTRAAVPSTLKLDPQLPRGHVAQFGLRADKVFPPVSHVVANRKRGFVVCVFCFAPALAAEIVLETMNMRACDTSVAPDVGAEACSPVLKRDLTHLKKETRIKRNTIEHLAVSCDTEMPGKSYLACH